MNKKLLLPLFLGVQILFLKVLSFFPEFVERFYSNGFYPFLSRILRISFGKIPFSIGDLLYFIVILLLLKWLWKQRKSWKTAWKDNLLSLVGFVSVFYFLFNLLWGVNYHRVPLYKKLAIEKDYSLEELMDFTKRVIVKVNAVHAQIEKNDSLKVSVPYTQKQLFEKTLNGYHHLGEAFPFFAYDHKSVKASLISTPLTYMGFSGYLNPFTNEAQVNDLIPKTNFATTTCHEMAHQIGYASESEANFIGYMASIYNDDIYFNYSGYTYALRYCLHNIEMKEEGKTKELLPLIRPGVLENFKDSDAFWDSHQNIMEPLFKVFYDNFLKLNQQKDGMESYSKFVDLLVNYYEKRAL
ncbi:MULTISPECIES: DUF3810 domain-containing protein [Flavobacterium]|uniref:DUF3810 domain-containing protein n=1 Tax=Flavobacterium TaxID=237 RepID=UPI0015AB93FE|nr:MULTISPECIES: DUF3810 domain-containing protein [Flavobacterium]